MQSAKDADLEYKGEHKIAILVLPLGTGSSILCTSKHNSSSRNPFTKSDAERISTSPAEHASKFSPFVTLGTMCGNINPKQW
jgi:hypothetical protein